MHSWFKIHVIVQRKPFFSGLCIYRTVIPSSTPFSLHLNTVLEGCFSCVCVRARELDDRSPSGLILLCDGLDLLIYLCQDGGGGCGGAT